MKIKIGELYDLYQKYGDLSFKVNTPYGYKNIKNFLQKNVKHKIDKIRGHLEAV